MKKIRPDSPIFVTMVAPHNPLIAKEKQAIQISGQMDKPEVEQSQTS